ncbi:AAA family ATPase [Candidatus Pacearchaeota archaeon]|nr:AAA family ATPase [Candidatus Pacearchaeota archaeon]
MNSPKIVGVVALKGGVGKTTVVANLGAALADHYNKKVLIVDANFSTPHLGLHVGLVNPKQNLHPVLSDDYSIYEAIYQHELGFHIIPGKLAPTEVNALALKEKLEPLREIYDIIIVDSSPSLNNEMAATMDASDELIVVSSPDYPTLSSTLHAVNLAKKQNTVIRGIVLNKVRRKKFELGSKDIAEASEVKVLASLPDSLKVLSATAKMVPVVIHFPKEEISHIYKKLAGSIIGEKYKKISAKKSKKKATLLKKNTKRKD